jgi:hypothetical protein
MGDSDRRPLPALLLLILALFGLASIQNFGGSAPKSGSDAEAKAEEKPAASQAGRRGRAAARTAEARVLEPLLDHFRTYGDAGDPLDTAYRETGRQVRGLLFLIATVPDPVRSTYSHRFDEWIGAIQRACESEGFVLSGFRFPWESGAPAAGAPDGPTPAADRGPAAEAPERDPGLLLFRGERAAMSPAVLLGAGTVVVPALSLDHSTPLLAVLLVPETPTLGLDKLAMGRSLDLAAKWDVRNRPWGGARTFNILGPNFSGSQTSLEQALAGWTSRAGSGPGGATEAALRVATALMGPGDTPRLVFGLAWTFLRPHATFAIISGCASAIRVEGLERCVPPPHSVDFSATVYESRVLNAALLEHLGGVPGEIAVLVEANTQFGRRSQRPGSGVIYYPFPLHISKLRGLYQKRGLLRDQSGQAMRSFERLPIPFGEAGDATDIPPMQTPGFTAAVDELVLDQILNDIYHRSIRTVGIIATDPLDVIFLARQIRQFVPDVRLFTTQSYLLFAHAQNVDDLRGMLVASTYPLFPSNQAWSYSYQGDATHVFFSAEDIQGVYNAAIAHLQELGNPAIPARFLEYGLPFDTPGSYAPADVASGVIAGPPPWINKARKPPVWIGMVGNHGIYPVTTVADPPDQTPGYLYVHDQVEEEYSGLLRLAPPGKDQADSWNQVRELFRPRYPSLWQLLFWGISLAGIAAAVVGILACSWAVAGPKAEGCEASGLRPAALARFLNCCRAEDPAKRGDLRGPGPYLPLALAWLLVVYVAISAPHLLLTWQAPWVPLDPRADGGALFAGLAYAVSCLLLVALALSLIAWGVMARRKGRGGAGAPAGGAVRRTIGRAAVVLVLVAILVPPVIWVLSAAQQDQMAYSFAIGGDAVRESLLRLARATAIPSGVSPVLPLVFIGVAGLAWAYSQLLRRVLYDQFTPTPPIGGDGTSGDAQTLQLIGKEGTRFDEILAGLAWPFQGPNVIGCLLLAGFLWWYLKPVVVQSLSPLFRGDMADWPGAVPGLLITLTLVLLGFHTLQLVVLWRRVNEVMKRLIHLPLIPALDRIPPRVAAWFKDLPRSGDGRFDLIRRQARALAHHGKDKDGSVREELKAAGGSTTADADAWAKFNDKLEALEPATVDQVVPSIRDILLDTWKPAPLQEVFPGAGEVKTADKGEGGPSGELHAIAVAVAGEKVPSPETPKRRPEWTRLAEDLLALLYLWWLAPLLAQVWTLIGFLVVGSLALLFAISSYPFTFQEHLLHGMGFLISVLVLMILVIVVGFNRDEMISRLSSTAPNRLKFDQNLVGGLLTYIVPLVGALAAISFDAADTLRTVLDPILRQFR